MEEEHADDVGYYVGSDTLPGGERDWAFQWSLWGCNRSVLLLSDVEGCGMKEMTTKDHFFAVDFAARRKLHLFVYSHSGWSNTHEETGHRVVREFLHL